MKIRRWAVLTAALYGLTLCVLTVPLIVALFAQDLGDINLRDFAELYSVEAYWVVIAVLTLLQSLLLLVPIQIVRDRPIRRGRWITLAVTAGFMMALLIAAGGLSIAEVIQLDDFLNEPVAPILCLVLACAGWIFWGVVFHRYARAANPDSALNRILDRLLTGSIAELLVAVPSHVYVRHKDYCCAGFGTFLGIATGLSVMLFAFGPGVFFLFAKRIRMLRTAAPAAGSGVGRHTRDALIWMAMSGVGLLSGWAVGFGQGLRDVGFGLGQVCFAVMGMAACLHGFRAWFTREPGRRRLLAGSACFAGVVFHSTLWWALDL